MVGLQPSSSVSTDCVAPSGDIELFSAREKFFKILRHGWKLNPVSGHTLS